MPLFNAPFLESTALALGRRVKSIGNHVRNLSCTRESSDILDERLNIDVETGPHGRTQVRLSVWPDGVMWLGVHQAGTSRQGGWRTQFIANGDLSGSTGTAIVERLEQTLSMTWDTDIDEAGIEQIWRDASIEREK